MDEAGVKTFAIGDIHGAYKALIQCFERSGFDRENDRLIVLGDVCDGYLEVRQCIDELLKVRNCDLVIGNHDLWALDWALKGIKEEIWLNQGGVDTIKSYAGSAMPQAHIDLLKGAGSYLVLNDKVFVHGGFDPGKPITGQDKNNFVWDRTLIDYARQIDSINPDYQLSDFKEIYVGHTPTVKFGSAVPLKLCNVWDMDTAAGWGGKLSIMNVETKEYWQSDLTRELYPQSEPRR